jgi:hypothetical protein
MEHENGSSIYFLRDQYETEIYFFYSGTSPDTRSKRPFIIMGILLAAFIISTIVLGVLFTREKVNKSTDGIEFMMFNLDI